MAVSASAHGQVVGDLVVSGREQSQGVLVCFGVRHSGLDHSAAT